MAVAAQCGCENFVSCVSCAYNRPHTSDAEVWLSVADPPGVSLARAGELCARADDTCKHTRPPTHACVHELRDPPRRAAMRLVRVREERGGGCRRVPGPRRRGGPWRPADRAGRRAVVLRYAFGFGVVFSKTTAGGQVNQRARKPRTRTRRPCEHHARYPSLSRCSPRHWASSGVGWATG